MDKVARDLGIGLIELTNPTLIFPPPGATFRKLAISSEALKADVVINLPKLKTHCQMMFTLGVKNLFGTVVAQRKAEWHCMAGIDRDTFASLLLDIYLTIKPAVTILDGVWGMEGHGPSNGRPKKINLVAAATDAVALDTSVCNLLGGSLRLFPIFRKAQSRDIGETDIRRIIFKGDAPRSFAIHDFQIPALDSLAVLPGSLHWFAKNYLVSKPVHEEKFCADCGQCEKICPAGAITVKNIKNTFDYDKCIRCYCCQEICPNNAIRFKKGLLVRLLSRFNR
jgi:ferredoxin